MDDLLGWHNQNEVAPKHCVEVPKTSFARQVNDLFMKYNIPLALLVAARTLAEGVNAAFTVMPKLLICSNFCRDLPAASSGRAIRRSGVPPINR